MAAPADVQVFDPRPPIAPRRRRRKWVARVYTGLIIFVALCVLLTGMGYLYIRWQLGKVKKINIPTLTNDVPGQVMNVLLVGSDSRADVTGDLVGATGQSTEGDRPGLSDTMMVLHVDPKAGQAAILSIPRDLFVQIPGENGRDRINSAYATGGPNLLIQTIQSDLGIQINHYVEVDLEGFKNIVDTLGGLKIYIDAPARDLKSGLDLPTAGCVQLDGFQALAYVRSRYYESYEAGHWVTDPTSDFGRIKRQQDFIRRMMRKAVSEGLTNPLTLNRLISIGVSNLTIDSTMSTSDIVNLARKFRSLDPTSVNMSTLPTTPYTTPAGADVLLLNQSEAHPLIDNINGKPPPGPPTPADVQVRVLNGNGGAGTASKTGAALQGVGFQVIGTGDADNFNYTQTVIHYGPDALAKAQLVQSYITPSGSTLTEDDTLGTADVAVIVGRSFTGVSSSPQATIPAPTTTVAPQTPAPAASGSTQPAC